jgi:zinc protease
MLRNQKDVVRNERRQVFDNRPYGKAEERWNQLLFPAPHPYHGVVIGSHEDLERATLDDVRQFFRSYYAPSNATLVVAGDFDAAQAKALVDKYFGTIPTAPRPPRPTAQPQAPPVKEVRETVEDNVQLPRVDLAWIGPLPLAADSQDAFLLAEVLGGSKSSRAFEKLVLALKIAQSVDCAFTGYTLGGVFECHILGKPGADPEALEKAFDAELASLRAKGPSTAELARAKARFLSTTLHNLEDIGKRADLLNFYNHYKGDPGYLLKDLAAVDAVSPKSALAAAKKWLDPSHRVVVLTVPAKGGGK